MPAHSEPSALCKGETSSTAKKRKSGAPPASKPQSDGRPANQRSVADLLFAYQQKPSSTSGRTASLSPSSKRQRLSCGDPVDRVGQIAPPVTALPPEKMYSFTSNKQTGNNVIDLTSSPGSAGSPPACQQARRVNGARPQKPNFNPHAGAKKLVVKNLRTGSKSDPKQYFDLVWGQLEPALSAIFNGRKVSFSLEELYRGVENLCRQGHGAELNNRLQRECEKHMSTILESELLERASGQNVDVLRAVLTAWSRWKSQLMTIRSIFFYMDRSFLLHAPKPSIDEMGTNLFRQLIVESPELNAKIINGACDLIQLDRDEEDLDLAIFRQSINMFYDLGVYTRTFEPRMLELSQQYITAWADRESTESGLADYVRCCERLMNKEENRCTLFNLNYTTRRALLSLLEHYLIERQESILVSHDTVAELLDQNAVADLERLYKLLDIRNLGGKLRPAFEAWIQKTGTAIVFDEKEQDQMVTKLLVLKKNLDAIWRVSFHKNTELGHALREAFESFINKAKKTSATWHTDNSKPGEMIAKYVDMLLRDGVKAIPGMLFNTSSLEGGEGADIEAETNAFEEDGEVNRQLDQVLDLFRFVHGKAVFEAFYKKDLARRLLMGRSASADAERSMLTRLKTECGAGFTQNLEQMFKDVELAREEMAAYKAIMEERNIKPKMDLSVNILSAAAWPTYPDIPVVIPAGIKAELDAFEKHYKSKHSGRKLDWKHALAHCQLKANYPKGKRELVVSSFQAIVLLLFNGCSSDEKLSYEFIKLESGLPEAEVKRTLQSLACAKLRPLTKHPKGRDINPEDTFTVNLGFSHEKYRVKINQVQLKETKEENKETHERVAADRNFETQAAIVRIMKSRKTISHAELVAEVIQATKSRGVLNVADIKKNIDRLIEKDYMEREEGNSYSYIA